MMTGGTTFRRKGLRLAPWYLFPAFLWMAAALFGLGFAIAAFRLKGWTGDRALFVILSGVLAWRTWASARAMSRSVRRLRQGYLILDEEGVRLKLQSSGEIRVGWSEISRVVRVKRWMPLNSWWTYEYRLDSFVLQTCRGEVGFTSIDIPSPQRAARRIAEQIGRTVES